MTKMFFWGGAERMMLSLKVLSIFLLHRCCCFESLLQHRIAVAVTNLGFSHSLLHSNWEA
jgi:hypothetical protein